MTEPALHEACAPLAFLLGTWRGEGSGEYPTIEPFRFAEEISFTHTGKPHLIYHQRTWHPEKGFPMHGEMGYWRPVGDAGVEILIVQPSGVCEIQAGSVRDVRVETRSVSVVTAPTAKPVEQIARAFTLDGDVLRYELSMAAVGQPLQPHLRAQLRKQ